MAFGAGVLISAVAYELVEEAFATSAGDGGVGLGLAVGSVTFFAGDAVIDRYGGAHRKESGGAQVEGYALAIVLGSVAFLAAVLVSNIPEAFAASSGLHTAGWSRAHVLGLWGLVTVVCGVAALVGYAAFGRRSRARIAFVLAFAGGAILTMLADTMMPEAFEHGGSPGRARHDARVRRGVCAQRARVTAPRVRVVRCPAPSVVPGRGCGNDVAGLA